MSTSVQRFLSDDRGLETVEYAIISGLIVTGLVTIIVAIGTWVQDVFSALQTEVAA